MATLRVSCRFARANRKRANLPPPSTLGLAVVVLALTCTALLPRAAAAAPPPPTVHSEAQEAEQRATTELQRLTELVAETEDRIARLADEALVAAGAYEDAAFAAEQARRAEAEAAAALEAADTEVADAEDAVGALARSSYITGGLLSQDLMLLDSESPVQLVERAGLVDALSDFQVKVLDDVESVQRSRTVAAEQSVAAAVTRERAEADAASLLAQSTRQLEQARAEVDALAQQLADQEEQLAAAQVAVLGVDGAEHARQQAAEEALAEQSAAAAGRAAAGGPITTGDWAVPLDGQITSDYGPRGGSMHYGVDIAAPMYTPIYSAGDGVVLQAGSASGFGQAIYIQHNNGDVTVYGHIETIYVSAGQQVVAGQEIAGVGSRGFSTGPHLHFEVQQGGMGGTRVDPLDWLAARGVYL
ncbi:MAG: peptidoglycan DD-metalloendopeptidase family protein [Geodermatophilaceae bacterium]